MKLGSITVILGVLALVLSLLQVHVLSYDTTSGQYSLQPRLVSFTLFSQSGDQVSAAPEKVSPLHIVLACVALSGIILAPIAWLQDRKSVIPNCVGAGLCLVSLLWYYFVLAALAGVIISIVVTIWWNLE